MIPKECKRLAEVDFPIAEVGRYALAEKARRMGTPHQAASLVGLAAIGLLKGGADGVCSCQIRVTNTDESAGAAASLPAKVRPWSSRRSQESQAALEKVVIKTLAGFLNANQGGTLLIGVDDAGTVVGLAADYELLKKKDRDGFELRLQQLIARDLGESISSFLTVTFHEIDGEDVSQITVDPSDHPVYVEEGQGAAFYLRTGNATRPLPVNEVVKFVQHRWSRTT